MKIRVLSIILVITSVLSYANNAIALDSDVSNNLGLDNYESISIIESATTYLTKCAQALYYYDGRNITENTLLQVLNDSEYDQTILEEQAIRFASFRESQETELNNDSRLKTINLESLNFNLELQENRIAFFGHLHESQNIIFDYFTPSYKVVNCISSEEYAIVDLYESLDYKYSHCEDPTFELTHYLISLFNINDAWVIAAVESDDQYFQTYYNIGFDLEKEILGYDEAQIINQNVNESADIPISSEITNLTGISQTRELGVFVNPLDNQSASTSSNIQPLAIVPGSDIVYNSANAINYALTYTTSSDSMPDPTYKNENFYYVIGTSCQLFVSQCLWAGFGGSNTLADINAKQGMDTDSREWWCTKTAWPTTYGSVWGHAGSFRSYLDYVAANPSETGIVCDTLSVSYTSDSLTNGSSSFTSTTLKGSAFHVNGTVALGHAIFINNATGTTRQTVYYTAYNGCAKNKQLSLSYPSSSSNTANNIYIMIPKKLRGLAPGDRLYASLQNVVSSGTSVSLKSYSTTTCQMLITSVYAPGATTASFSFPGSNTSSTTASYTFNAVGDWKVVVTSVGPNLSNFTYIIRVV